MPKYQGFVEMADLILKDKDIAALKADYDKIAAEPILDWYQQSQALHPKAYPDKTPVGNPTERTYCKHTEKDENGVDKTDKNGVAIVTNATSVADVDLAYMEGSAEIIKMQILKGGLRLAHVLNDIAEKQYADPVGLDMKTQDIKGVLDQLVNFIK
jgi:hypothetical protein